MKAAALLLAATLTSCATSPITGRSLYAEELTITTQAPFGSITLSGKKVEIAEQRETPAKK